MLVVNAFTTVSFARETLFIYASLNGRQDLRLTLLWSSADNEGHSVLKIPSVQITTGW